MNVVFEPFASNGCFSGSTVLALSKYAKVLKWILREIGWSGMDWIDLAQDRGQWRPLVSTVMNLRVL
jgi:hypothetical protein